MLTIRLQRRGKRNKAFFRIVLTEHTKPAGSGEQEILGTLNPHTKDIELKEGRIKYWLEKGAQMSQSIRDLFVKKQLIERKELKFTKKNPKKKKAKGDEKDAGAEKKKEEKPAEKKEKPDDKPTEK